MTDTQRGLEALNELVAFFVEGRPVGDAGVEEPNVDVVEVIWGIYPFATAVVDFESEVWGDGNALARRKVCSCFWHQCIGTDRDNLLSVTNHICFWVFVCKVSAGQSAVALGVSQVPRTMPRCLSQYQHP